MNKPLVRNIDCLRLHVANLEDGLTFYQKQLGHELIWQTESAAGLRIPGSQTEIVIQTVRQKLEVDLIVDSVDEAIERFQAAGGKVIISPFEVQAGYCTVVADPWGNQLVLLDGQDSRLDTQDLHQLSPNGGK